MQVRLLHIAAGAGVAEQLSRIDLVVDRDRDAAMRKVRIGRRRAVGMAHTHEVTLVGQGFVFGAGAVMILERLDDSAARRDDRHADRHRDVDCVQHRGRDVRADSAAGRLREHERAPVGPGQAIRRLGACRRRPRDAKREARHPHAASLRRYLIRGYVTPILCRRPLGLRCTRCQTALVINRGIR